MQTLQNISDTAQKQNKLHINEVAEAAKCNILSRLWAALIFFTRLPLWRISTPPKKAFESVVEFWPLTGWLTGAVMGGIIYMLAPYNQLMAVTVAIAARMLLTGALHEDGLADFFDGFGGGCNRTRILEIMKDSHIGTYGVLSLILYCLAVVISVGTIDYRIAAPLVAFADPFAKMVASHIIFLPYARAEQEAKSKTLYRPMSFVRYIFMVVQGLLPLGLFILYISYLANMEGAVILENWLNVLLIICPLATAAFLTMLINKKIRGYTGDCCGALFLLTELSILITASFIM
ncbi:MAG: adenosylcobinamide-GDP ribazoletransferase [Bacteroidales bacterium]|nr:adenosylcobinamide-GDP ribazoletransferase [Bacteroidales bacterium]